MLYSFCLISSPDIAPQNKIAKMKHLILFKQLWNIQALTVLSGLIKQKQICQTN